MGSLVFVAVAGTYLVYASRDRSNALAGAAVLLPFNQYLPSSGIPIVNVHLIVMVGLAWRIVRTPRPNLGAYRPVAPIPLTLFALVLVVRTFRRSCWTAHRNTSSSS